MVDRIPEQSRSIITKTKNDPENPVIMAAKEFTKQGIPVSLSQAIEFSVDRESSSGKRLRKIPAVTISTTNFKTDLTFSFMLGGYEMKALVAVYEGTFHKSNELTGLFKEISGIDDASLNRFKGLSCLNSAKSHDTWASFFRGESEDDEKRHILAAKKDREEAVRILGGQEPPSKEDIRSFIAEIATEKIAYVAERKKPKGPSLQKNYPELFS